MSEPTTQPANTGTGQPGGSPNEPGHGEQPKYITQETFNGTAAQISRINKTLETLTQQKPLIEQLTEIGLFEKDETGAVKPGKLFAPQQPAQQPGKPKEEDNPLARKVADLEKRLADEERAKNEQIQKTAESERKRVVVAALSKLNAVNPERDQVHIANQFYQNEDGQYVAKGKDEYGSTIEIPLEQFVANYLKANPELQKSAAASGSGSPNGAGKPGGTSTGKQIPYATWTDPDWYKENRDKIDKGEFQLLFK